MQLSKSGLPAVCLFLATAVAACGGSSANPSGAATSSSPAPASASASPSAAAPSASAKPAGSTQASAAAVSASAKPAASASAAAGGATKLEMSYSEIYEGQIPVWVAYEAGLFKHNGLDVNMTYIASAQAISALVAGQTQIAQGGGSEALSAASGGAPLTVIGNVVPVYPYILEVTSDIKTISDLKGKKVGVSNIGSASDIATRVALNKVGLVPDKDVSIITVGSSVNRTAALQSGAIQGGLAQPPDTYILEAQGLHPLIDMTQLKAPTVNNGIVAKADWIKANHDTTQKYVDSVVQGIAKMKADHAFAANVLKQYMKLDDLSVATKTVDWASANLFPNVPTTKPDDFLDAVTVLSEKNDKVKSFDLAKLIDNSFVDNAASRGLAAK